MTYEKFGLWTCTYCWFSCKYTAVRHCSGCHSNSLSLKIPYSLLGHNSHWVLAIHNFCKLVVSRHSICSCFPFQDRWVLSTNCNYYDCENKWILNDVIALDQSFNFYEAFRIGLHTKPLQKTGFASHERVYNVTYL